MDYKIKINNIKESCSVIKIDDDATNFAATKIIANFKNQDCLFLAKNQLEIAKIKQQLIYFNPAIEDSHEILTFYPWDCRPYDFNCPKASIITNRIRTLNKIINSEQKNILLITSINAILQKVPAKEEIQKNSLIIRKGQQISIENIVTSLVNNGYIRQSSSYVPGDFSVRGGIIDLVTTLAGENIGYRIDMFSDEIESIKSYNPISQLSQDNVNNIEILPAGEIILNEESIANFRANYRKIVTSELNFDYKDEVFENICNNRYLNGIEHYLPLFFNKPLVNITDLLKNPVIFTNSANQKIAADFYEQAIESFNSRIEDIKINNSDTTFKKPIPTSYLYDSYSDFLQQNKQNSIIEFNNFSNPDQKRAIDLEIKTVPEFHLAARTKKVAAINLTIDYIEKSGKKALFCANNDNTLQRIKNELLQINKSYPVAQITIDRGFETSDFIAISQNDLYGQKSQQKTGKKNKNAAKKILDEAAAIAISELVVHRDYGIGRFEGITEVAAAGVKNDMIKIAYGGGDNLFISVEDIDLITRYGADNPLIELDRLGVASWKNRKEKIKKKIKVAASELLKVAAARELKKATPFIANDLFYEEFKNNFGFVETPDQHDTILEIEEDLASGKPMDRLICGDVGFGKTEVAMRAAFIVSSTNYDYDKYIEAATIDKIAKLTRKKEVSQITIVTPTTILCRQHYKNFTERFAGTGIKIAQLSRLTTQTQNRKTKEALEKGEIDIVIGTHALLGKNIKFKNLALIIIDEEQHFGVAQKERLKELKNECHILTLSATPIPRTLQMSLTGIKDLSLIATPPVDRLAVRNFVMPFDITTAKEAILREYQRGGKVFFVTPFIKDIDEIAKKLQKTLPEEISCRHAHGQMPPNQIEDIMNDFYDDKIDVLLSTTIIESGIDVASANTIIINKAEHFGLSQLYQLRGRVGRSKKQAYAYLMTNRKEVNEQAKRKLKVMQNLDELGVGFTVASHDMDIRGTGDILGDEQSGHIKETGVELYQQMLYDEIQRVKNKIEHEPTATTNFEFNPQVKLAVSLAIEESYIEDLAIRMSFYKKISKVSNIEEQNKMESELLDRFGKIPTATRNLIAIAIIKNSCKDLKIAKIQAISQGILVSFKNNKFSKSDQLLDIIFKSNSQIKIQNNHAILFSFDYIFSAQQISEESQEFKKITAANKILKMLQQL